MGVVFVVTNLDAVSLIFISEVEIEANKISASEKTELIDPSNDSNMFVSTSAQLKTMIGTTKREGKDWRALFVFQEWIELDKIRCQKVYKHRQTTILNVYLDNQLLIDVSVLFKRHSCTVKMVNNIHGKKEQTKWMKHIFTTSKQKKRNNWKIEYIVLTYWFTCVIIFCNEKGEYIARPSHASQKTPQIIWIQQTNKNSASNDYYW